MSTRSLSTGWKSIQIANSFFITNQTHFCNQKRGSNFSCNLERKRQKENIQFNPIRLKFKSELFENRTLNLTLYAAYMMHLLYSWKIFTTWDVLRILENMLTKVKIFIPNLLLWELILYYDYYASELIGSPLGIFVFWIFVYF